MANHNLIEKVKSGFYKTMAAGALGFGAIYGCGDIVEPPVDMPPKATMQSISPVSGISFVEVTARYQCVDDKGIREYRIINGSQTTTSSSPIDALIPFTESGSLKLECEDTGGNVASYGPVNITVTQPPLNNPPQTSLVVSPTSGVSPLGVRVQYSCTDPDGADDIEQSRLVVGNDTLTTTSTDSTFTFNESKTITGYCIDKAGEESTAGPVGVEVIPPSEPSDQIAFYSSNSNNIHLVNEDGSGLEQLTFGPQDLEPSFSPDGRYMAFHTNRNSGLEIYIRDMSDGGLFRLTEGIETSAQPAFSPDGTQIAFRFIQGSSAGIGLIKVDGTGFTKIIEKQVGGRIPGHPTWSPDGTQIAYQDYVNGNWEIFTMNSDGSNQANRTNSPDYDVDPSWSKDGRIVFVSDPNPNDEFYELEINTMDSDGGNRIQLTHNSAKDLDPSWTSDGRIVFARRDNPSTTQDIWIMDADGTNERKIFESHLSHERGPAFRPRQ